MNLQTTFCRRRRDGFSRCRLILPILIVVAVVCGSALPVPAAIVLSMPESLSPGSGSFNVLITNTDSSGSYTIAGFDLRLTTDSGDFTAVEIPLSGYIFQGYSFDLESPQPFSDDPFSNQGFPAQDTFYDDSLVLGGTELGAGQTMVLARVSYQSDSGVDFVPEFVLSDTKLFDDDEWATELEVETAQTAIPEPATLVIWSFGLLGLGVCGWRRRRAV